MFTKSAGRISVAIFLNCALTGCNIDDFTGVTEVKREIIELKSEVQKLRAELKTTQGAIEGADDSISDLQSDIISLKTKAAKYSEAIFDPAAEEAFQRLDTSVGSFLVIVRDVSQKADGVKVSLLVGNITSAQVSNAVFKIEWGEREPNLGDDGFFDKYAQWLKTIQSVEHKISSDLHPGRWNKTQLALPGIQLEKFGYLKLSMDASQVSLTNP